ncbi:MAG: ABC-2 transporter permease [Clostridiales bacterium]|nr:ABC-2 transporter permease [Clostridiales bacterium]
MKGLLIKDLKLMKNQKKFFITFFMIAVIFLITYENKLFAVSYTTMIFTIFVMSTISYDEYENGYPFLFVLPIRRSDYVNSKYCFGLLCCLAAWLLATLYTTIYQITQKPDGNLLEWIGQCCMIIPFFLLFLAFSIPVQLKFGNEKARVVIFGILGGSTLIIYAASKLIKRMNVNVSVIIQLAESISNLGLVIGCIAGSIVLLMISYIISIHIMNKKQF